MMARRPKKTAGRLPWLIHRCLVLPPTLEPGRCQLGVTDGVLDVLVAQIRLQRARVLAGIGEREAAGMAQHVRVGLDLEPGSLASAAHELLEVADGHRRAALADEQERRSALGLAVKPSQGPELAPGQRMRRWGAVLNPGDRQRRGLEVDLGPLQIANFGGAQAVTER